MDPEALDPMVWAAAVEKLLIGPVGWFVGAVIVLYLAARLIHRIAELRDSGKE